MADLKVDGLVVDKSGFIQSYPVGTIIMRASTTIPDGWLLCDGRPVAQADYPALYAHLGSTYGATAPNFNLPPLVVNATHNPLARIPVGTVSSEPTYPSTFGHNHGTTTFNFPANVASGNYSHAHNVNTYGASNADATQSHNHNRAGGNMINLVSNGTNTLRASSTATTQYLNQNHDHTFVTNYGLGNNNAVNNAHSHTLTLHGTETSSHTHGISYSGTTATGTSAAYYPVSVQLYFLIKT
jgi:microcystin-dependent protein